MEDKNSNLPYVYQYPVVYKGGLPALIEEPKKKKRSLKDRLLSSFTNRIEVVRKVDWFEFVEQPSVRLLIKPDSSARNWRTEDLLKTIAEQFRLPIDRLIREGLRVKGYRVQERTSFEIEFRNGSIRFYIIVPKNIAPLIKRRAMSIWDKASIEEFEEDVPKYNRDNTAIYEMIYRKHDMFSLHTDHKDNLPLASILEAGKLLGKEERASVFAYFDPIHQITWQHEINGAWEKLRKGISPRKFNGSGREVFMMLAVGVSKLFGEIVGTVSEIIGSKSDYAKSDIDPEASQFVISNLTNSTKQKPSKSAIKTSIWTLAESEDHTRADLISRTLAQSFNDLSGDNELLAREVKSKRYKEEILRTVETNKKPRINIRSNTFSVAEASKIVQIPGADLQESNPNIDKVETTQVEISNKSLLNNKGLLLGYSIFKGCHNTIYQPIKDIEELSLPHVGIGGMGQGKTRGLLANYLLESVLKGFGGLAIDPAKRQIGDELEAAVKAGMISKDQFERIDLSKVVFCLDFCEALYDANSKARLANIIIHFFGVSEDTTGQTERFLRAAVIGMRTGKLIEIIKIFEDEKYLDSTIKYLEDQLDPDDDLDFNLSTLKEYKSYQPPMRRKILSPIYNRLNDILSDPWLMKCMKSKNSLDMVQILSQKKAFVFDVPDDGLDKSAIDVIVSLLSLKIDLAMRLREKVTGTQFPFFVLIDEPHHFGKSTGVWEDAVVESRKYRVTYFWTFHYWEQIPAKLQRAIKNALPHYHLYPSSEDTFKGLKSMIRPFTVEEALTRLEQYHAINIIRAGGKYNTPFIAKMADPPSYPERQKQFFEDQKKSLAKKTS